jgi:hypothetical protein
MADAQTAFRKLAAATQGLPGVVEGKSYGYPSFMVRKKFLCRVKDADTVVVMCPLEEKEMLMAAAPDIYFETSHYKGWPAILVRINDIDAAELRHRVRRAWLMQAPKSLARTLDADKV